MDFRRITLQMFCRKLHNVKLSALKTKPIADKIDTDYIGPPDKISNLRPYVRCIEQNETDLAGILRKKRIEVEEWNQLFWSNHNTRFYKEKMAFIQAHKLSGKDEMTADEMSEFYKMFLDNNRKNHLSYNMEWYKKNYSLLLLALQVELQRLAKKLWK